MKKRLEIARDVIAGYYGSGEKRVSALKKEGYNPDQVQNDVNTLLCCRENIVGNMKAFAKKIADDDRYKYIYWTEPYGRECAVCHPHDGKNKGWQCIGYTIAVWHHGGLPIPCNCGVIDNGTGERIMKAKTDAEALKIAQNHLKIKDIKVIRNGGKAIPKDKAQAGDMALMFVNGNVFQHMYFIMSSTKIADSNSGLGDANAIRADRSFSGSYVSGLKVLIRYTGKGLCSAPKRTVDQLAHEVIEGLWGSGESRKTALTQAGHNYDAVQKRVNEILNLPKPKPSGKYTGKIPSYRLTKTNAQVIADTIKWAKWIAGDNNFHYGYGSHAHHNGCYFCGTQYMKMGHGLKMPEHTYCCNPFVGAAWAHGGGDATAYKMCHNCRSWGFAKSEGYEKSKLFNKLGKPAYSSLKVGDVLCSDGHVALYIGNGKVIQASGGDDNVIKSKGWNKSISTGTWNGWSRAYRYNGKVDCDRVILHGECSDRVADLQRFLDWYFDGKVGSADGCFGDNTLKWVKAFQEKEMGKGQGDGSVGEKTIAAMKKVKK